MTFLEGSLSLEEVEKSLSALQTYKSPSLDGWWNLEKNNESFESGSLPNIMQGFCLIAIEER